MPPECLITYVLINNTGNFVKKPMSACTGREILTEVLGHLNIEAEAPKIMETSICIPCMMPFITSQFLRREKGDCRLCASRLEAGTSGRLPGKVRPARPL